MIESHAFVLLPPFKFVSAVELEDGTEKSAVTPGPLAPARELLGEMLLEMKEPAQVWHNSRRR